MPTRHVIRFVLDPADLNGGPLLASYDPDAHDGRGDIVATTDPAQALTFATTAEMIDCYQQTSTVCPLRPDGQPNRPLTAYTVQFDTLED